ncbi:hypothetical protein D6C80_09353 [Aureobasidium pullulans]|nr:hypothetical protein D6C80_09353 [Aureobasidium pullulans]
MVHFPNEIWLEIVRNIVPDANLQDLEDYKTRQCALASLCLISTQLYPIAQPALHGNYIKFASPWPEEERLANETQHQVDGNDSPYRKNTQLENFLHTLIERPDLAAAVVNLRIGRYNDKENSYSRYRNVKVLPLNPTLSGIFESAIEVSIGPSTEPPSLLDGHISTRDCWKGELRAGIEGAEVALLLAILPNVKFLDLEVSGEPTPFLGSFVRVLCEAISEYRAWAHEDTEEQNKKGKHRDEDGEKKGAEDKNQKNEVGDPRREEEKEVCSCRGFWCPSHDPPPVLKHLECLSVRAFDTQNRCGFNLQECLPLLTIPTLVSFRGYGLNYEYYMYNVGKTKSPLPLDHLRSLKLEYSQLNGRLFTGLLGGTRLQLQTLIIDTYGVLDSRVDESHFHERLQQALVTMASTLEHLVFVTPEDTMSMLNLQKLTRLRYLELGIASLVGRKIFVPHPQCITTRLPQNLQHLCLRRADDEVWEPATALIKAKLTSLDFVELKVIEIRFVWSEDEKAENHSNSVTGSSSKEEEAIMDSGVADESSHLGVLQALANEAGVEIKILTNEPPIEVEVEGWCDSDEHWGCI